MERMVTLTAADRRWIDDLVKDVNDTWNEQDPTRPTGMQSVLWSPLELILTFLEDSKDLMTIYGPSSKNISPLPCHQSSTTTTNQVMASRF